MDDFAIQVVLASEAPDLSRYQAVRRHSEGLAAALTPEDQCVQSMPDASPVKWHRAHTTWFFEQFVLIPSAPGYKAFDDRFSYLFNSYYEAVGARHPRPSRGLLTRPSSDEVTAYRRFVDEGVAHWLPIFAAEASALVELGLQHEQQHQELMLTDMMHAFAQSPLAPAVLPGWREPACDDTDMRFVRFPGGISRIGHDRFGILLRQ